MKKGEIIFLLAGPVGSFIFLQLGSSAFMMKTGPNKKRFAFIDWEETGGERIMNACSAGFWWDSELLSQWFEWMVEIEAACFTDLATFMKRQENHHVTWSFYRRHQISGIANLVISFLFFYFKGNWGQSQDQISRTPGTHVVFTPSLPYVQASAGHPPSAAVQG